MPPKKPKGLSNTQRMLSHTEKKQPNHAEQTMLSIADEHLADNAVHQIIAERAIRTAHELAVEKNPSDPIGYQQYLLSKHISYVASKRAHSFLCFNLFDIVLKQLCLDLLEEKRDRINLYSPEVIIFYYNWLLKKCQDDNKLFGDEITYQKYFGLMSLDNALLIIKLLLIGQPVTEEHRAINETLSDQKIALINVFIGLRHYIYQHTYNKKPWIEAWFKESNTQLAPNITSIYKQRRELLTQEDCVLLTIGLTNTPQPNMDVLMGCFSKLNTLGFFQPPIYDEGKSIIDYIEEEANRLELKVKEWRPKYQLISQLIEALEKIYAPQDNDEKQKKIQNRMEESKKQIKQTRLELYEIYVSYRVLSTEFILIFNGSMEEVYHSSTQQNDKRAGEGSAPAGDKISIEYLHWRSILEEKLEKMQKVVTELSSILKGHVPQENNDNYIFRYIRKTPWLMKYQIHVRDKVEYLSTLFEGISSVVKIQHEKNQNNFKEEHFSRILLAMKIAKTLAHNFTPQIDYILTHTNYKFEPTVLLTYVINSQRIIDTPKTLVDVYVIDVYAKLAKHGYTPQDVYTIFDKTRNFWLNNSQNCELIREAYRHLDVVITKFPGTHIPKSHLLDYLTIGIQACLENVTGEESVLHNLLSIAGAIVKVTPDFNENELNTLQQNIFLLLEISSSEIIKDNKVLELFHVLVEQFAKFKTLPLSAFETLLNYANLFKITDDTSFIQSCIDLLNQHNKRNFIKKFAFLQLKSERCLQSLIDEPIKEKAKASRAPDPGMPTLELAEVFPDEGTTEMMDANALSEWQVVKYGNKSKSTSRAEKAQSSTGKNSLPIHGLFVEEMKSTTLVIKRDKTSHSRIPTTTEPFYKNGDEKNQNHCGSGVFYENSVPMPSLNEPVRLGIVPTMEEPSKGMTLQPKHHSFSFFDIETSPIAPVFTDFVAPNHGSCDTLPNPVKLDHSIKRNIQSLPPIIHTGFQYIGKDHTVDYDFQLMSSSDTPANTKEDTVYLCEESRCYIMKGMKEPASLPEELNLTNLSQKLKNSNFKTAILDITTKAQHTSENFKLSFVVGSAVLELLQSTKTATIDLTKIRDIDFVSAKPPKKFGTLFKFEGMEGFLYMGRYIPTNTPFDCFVPDGMSNITTEADFFGLDLEHRDFTVCALYCNRKGEIFDPTGFGIDDQDNKVLRLHKCTRTNSYAEKVNIAIGVLREDPVRILRSMKYLLKGYTPSKELLEALEKVDFEPTSLQQLRIKLFMNKFVKSYSKEAIWNSFKKYKLLNKSYLMHVKSLLEECEPIDSSQSASTLNFSA